MPGLVIGRGHDHHDLAHLLCRQGGERESVPEKGFVNCHEVGVNRRGNPVDTSLARGNIPELAASPGGWGRHVALLKVFALPELALLCQSAVLSAATELGRGAFFGYVLLSL